MPYEYPHGSQQHGWQQVHNGGCERPLSQYQPARFGGNAQDVYSMTGSASNSYAHTTTQNDRTSEYSSVTCGGYGPNDRYRTPFGDDSAGGVVVKSYCRSPYVNGSAHQQVLVNYSHEYQ